MQHVGDLVACAVVALLTFVVVGERHLSVGGILGRTALETGPAYEIVGVQSGKCVEVPTGSASLQLGACDGSSRQHFRAETMGPEIYRLRNEADGRCMDVANVSNDAGATVNLYECGDGKNQQWTVQELAPGVAQLTAFHSGKVLDVSEASTADGARLQQWWASRATNQSFRLRRK